MTQSQPASSVLLPERLIPPPPTVSGAAQAFLGQPGGEAPAYPPAADKAGWRALLQEQERWLAEGLAASAAAFPQARIQSHDLAEATLYEIDPGGATPAPAGKAILFVHGGAFVMGGGIAAAHAALPLAAATGLRIYSVDYRMPPDHPFPAGLDDTVGAYRLLLERYGAQSLGVCGISAGGGMAAAAMLKARDAGLALPAACVLGTPEVDLTESGDSFETNCGLDVWLRRRLAETIALYADGHDLRDPYLSPVFADFRLGFPPTLLTTGTRDMFLSNTVILHQALLRAGQAADLRVFEAMPHGGFSGATPEDAEVLRQHADFLRRALVQSV